MGEHNKDFMYRKIKDFVKNLQRTAQDFNFDITKSIEEDNALDALAHWALENNKIKLKEGYGLDIGQDEVELV